jgi:hypothetical protein
MIQDISYVTSGIYSGRTALSILVWITGSIFLGTGTLINLIRPDCFNHYYPQLSGFLLIVAGVSYVVSSIAQFGPFLNGSAGISMPFGGFALMLLGIGMMIDPSFKYYYPV